MTRRGFAASGCALCAMTKLRNGLEPFIAHGTMREDVELRAVIEGADIQGALVISGVD